MSLQRDTFLSFAIFYVLNLFNNFINLHHFSRIIFPIIIGSICEILFSYGDFKSIDTNRYQLYSFHDSQDFTIYHLIGLSIFLISFLIKIIIALVNLQSFEKNRLICYFSFSTLAIALFTGSSVAKYPEIVSDTAIPAMVPVYVVIYFVFLMYLLNSNIDPSMEDFDPPENVGDNIGVDIDN